MNKKWIAAILIYLGLIAMCCIALYAVPSVRGMLEKTYIAEYGSIDVTDEVSAFIVRDDKVYIAAKSGKVNRLADPDKLVKANTRIVEFKADETDEETEEDSDASVMDSGSLVYGRYSGILHDLGDAVKKTDDGFCKKTGYVSYYVDGAEAKFRTKNLSKLRYSDYKELKGRKAVKTADNRCGKSYPLFKITKNKKWYLVYYIGKSGAGKYVPGETVELNIDGTTATATVSQVLTGKKYAKITLACKAFFEGFLEERTLDTEVTIMRASGLILENDSIVSAPDGRRGVFVKDKLGEHNFYPVSVKADDGRKCVVYSDIYVDENGNFVETIGPYDEIVAEPNDEDIASLKVKDKKSSEEKNKEKTEAPASQTTDSKEPAADENAKAENKQDN